MESEIGVNSGFSRDGMIVEPTRVSYSVVSSTAFSKDGGRRPTNGHDATLDGMRLKPGWYRLDVNIDGGRRLVSARISFLDSNRPKLSMRLEPKDGGAYSKIVRISGPACAVTINAEGGSAERLMSIEIGALGWAAVFTFMCRKGLRYILAKRGKFNPRWAIRQFVSAFRGQADFAFRDSYEPEDTEAAYPRWRAIHEDPMAGVKAAAMLEASVAQTPIRIALLVGDGLDLNLMLDGARSSLTSSVIEIVPAPPMDNKEFSRAIECCDFVLPIDYPGQFEVGAIERMVLAMTGESALTGVFADSDRLDQNGARTEPRLKPPWDRELLWSKNYIRAPLLARVGPYVTDALAVPGASSRPGYAIALMLIECRNRATLDRIPEVLFHETAEMEDNSRRFNGEILREHLKRHCQGCGLTMRKDGIQRVIWPLPRTAPHVSIIIPSRDNPTLLKNCIESIHAHTVGMAPEIIVADNGSLLDATRTFLEEIAGQRLATVISCPGPFNFSKINNQARRHAKGDVIVLMNDDTEVISPDWLTELTSLAVRPDVGAVGGLLLYPNGRIQHAGVLLGVGGAVADHAFRHLEGDAPGYLELVRCRREVSAVTGACLAVSVRHFDAVGGLDENLPVTLNDVDLCLRLRDRGLVNIWTPWAVLKHLESTSRGVDLTDHALRRQAAEVELFTTRWARLKGKDPHYHPRLSEAVPDYRLAV
jgi:GT2 family glycosyltransferase